MSWMKAGAGYWEITDTSGGYNASKVISKIRDNQASDSRNWYYWNGKLRNLFGTAAWCADKVNGTAEVSGVTQFKLSTGTTYVVATAGDKIKYYSTGTGTWADITGALTITPGYKFTFASMGDKLIATNGKDAPIKWTGTGNAAVLGGSPPYGKYVLPYHGYLVMLNCTIAANKYVYRAYRSGFGTPESWDASHYWSFDNSNGSEITGGKMLGHRLVVYHDDTMSFLSGKSTSTFTITADAIPGVGCVSHYSITGRTIPREVYNKDGAPTGNFTYQYGHLFRGREGFYFFDGGNVTMVSECLLDDNSDLNMSDIGNCYSVYNPDYQQIWNFMSLGSNTTNDGGYLYDCIHGGFWPIYGFKAECACLIKESGAHKVLLGCSDGMVRYLDTTTHQYDSSTLDNYWYSKWFSVTKPQDVKLMRDFILFVEAVGNANLRIKLEFDLEYAKTSQTGLVSLISGGATYPGTYDEDTYSATGVDMRDGTIGGESFKHFRIKVWMTENVNAAIEKFGTQLESLGDRRLS